MLENQNPVAVLVSLKRFGMVYKKKSRSHPDGSLGYQKMLQLIRREQNLVSFFENSRNTAMISAVTFDLADHDKKQNWWPQLLAKHDLDNSDATLFDLYKEFIGIDHEKFTGLRCHLEGNDLQSILRNYLINIKLSKHIVTENFVDPMEGIQLNSSNLVANLSLEKDEKISADATDKFKFLDTNGLDTQSQRTMLANIFAERGPIAANLLIDKFRKINTNPEIYTKI